MLFLLEPLMKIRYLRCNPPPPLPTQLICYNASLIGGCGGGGEKQKNVIVLFINRSKFYEEMKHMLIWNQVLNK